MVEHVLIFRSIYLHAHVTTRGSAHVMTCGSSQWSFLWKTFIMHFTN